MLNLAFIRWRIIQFGSICCYIQCPRSYCTCSVYSVIKIALKSRTSSGPSLRAGAGSYYELNHRLLLYETKGKWNQKNFLALQYTQQLEILATVLKVQTLVQLYVVKTELQITVTHNWTISNFYLHCHSDWRSLIFLSNLLVHIQWYFVVSIR